MLDKGAGVGQSLTSVTAGSRDPLLLGMGSGAAGAGAGHRQETGHLEPKVGGKRGRAGK